MNEKVYEQLMAVRASGKSNMLDTNAVQRIAFEENYHELVLFIEENRVAYVHFIMTGEMPTDE